MKKLIFFGVLGLFILASCNSTVTHTHNEHDHEAEGHNHATEDHDHSATGMNPVKGTVTKQQAATSKRPKHIVTRSSFRK